MAGRKIIIIAVLGGGLSFALGAQISSVDSFLGLFAESKKVVQKRFEFNGLSFVYEESVVSCTAGNADTLVCRVGQGSILFEKKKVSSSAAIPLVRLARKQAWQGQYRLVNQYVEAEVSTGLGAKFLQKAVVYHLDNILWPVLIRAYDVVIDEHTCISITTKCDFRDWPAVEKEIGSIEASLSRTARH